MTARCTVFWWLSAAVFIIAVALVYLDYRAYRLRFPDAPAWTYLFK